MTEKQIAFICDGEQIRHEVEPVIIPRIGEWVQLYTQQTYKTFVVKHVLHKFVRGFGPVHEPTQRFIIIIEEIKEEV